jgi:transcriptional regulator with XRE-family HTH domain
MTIGQIIKKLRKERNLTQEELAEQLNITPQAVSKWENEAGLPDISQIVPIASVFGVSTDVLFGTFETSDEIEVKKILEAAYSLKGRTAYDTLQEGLRRYPNNMWLLMNTLEYGNSLCFRSGYDKITGLEIYPECIRLSNLVVSYAKNITDILRAHMIMVILHSAYGNKEKARDHAEKFPWRCDMTFNVMSAYIAYHDKNYHDEAEYCQKDI